MAATLLVGLDAEMRRAAEAELHDCVGPTIFCPSLEEAFRVLGTERFQVVFVHSTASSVPQTSKWVRRVQEQWPLIQVVCVWRDRALSLPDAVGPSSVVFPWEAGELRRALSAALLRYDAIRVEVVDWMRARAVDAQSPFLTHEAEVIARTQRQWESVFDAIGMPVVLLATDRTIRRANLAYAKTAAADVRALPGKRCHEALFGRPTPCEGCPVYTVFEGSEEAATELETQEGRRFRVRAYRGSEPGTAVCSYEDITRERQRTLDTVQREKMVALGQLSGGVAHEINNPIASILAFAQLMKTEGQRSADDLEMLDMIEQSALRCKRIVESMLRFSSRAHSRKRISLIECLKDTVMLFQLVLKTTPRIHLTVEIPPALPDLMADRGQLEQVALNLLQNAAQAMPEKQGKICLEAGTADGQVFFRVKDTGTGIKPEVLPRIFEPTFSTKAPGEGTGFGLAIAEGIVRDHGGRIRVDTKLGEGTTFTVSLPQAPPS